MENAEKNFKCMRIVSGCDATLQEIESGKRAIEKWYVTKKYETQKCGPQSPHPWYETVMEDHDLEFEELIFKDGKCVGAYYGEKVFIFDKKDTHFQKTHLGEMPISQDQSIEFYDYYYLCERRDNP